MNEDNLECDFTEAEIQLLASLEKASQESLPSTRQALIQGGDRFWRFLEDWSDAFESLKKRGLITGDDSTYRLSDSGSPYAKKYHTERPDRFWYHYQGFWTTAYQSKAHSKLCERVFGKNLCQDGMVDMRALDYLLELLDLKPDDHVLDIGCGIGLIAEYIADQTGARVTGLDYSGPAIDFANKLMRDKGKKLDFVKGDLNSLNLTESTFDAVVSLDTLYWVSDLNKTLAQLLRAIKSGGQLGIFLLQSLEEDAGPETLKAQHTDLSRSLSNLGVKADTYDYTIQNGEFWQRNYQAAQELLEDFQKEGNGYIAESLIKESEEDFLPVIKSGELTRYLYHVRIQGD